jgi:NADH dehydrogenase
MNIFLLEGAGKTLATMSEKSSEQSCKYLKRLGVTVFTNTFVKDYNGKNVQLQNGNTIPSATVIWAAGIKGNIPAGIDQSLIVKSNRIKTDRRCRLVTDECIYAIGDLNWMETPKFPNGLPQVAPVAIQQADMLAENLKRIERKSTKFFDFEYHDKGSMATVGRNLAVVDIPKPRLHFGGLLAWFIWMSLHLMLILGVKNRLFVFMNWLYNYITYDQNLRLVYGEFKRGR